jgi:kinesin family protein 15
MSAARRIDDWEEDDNGGVTGSVVSVPRHAQSFEFCEDPSFWKEHNVQVSPFLFILFLDLKKVMI